MMMQRLAAILAFALLPILTGNAPAQGASAEKVDWRWIYLTNTPAGPSHRLRVVANITAGNGKILEVSVFDQGSNWVPIDIPCSGTSHCEGTVELPAGCMDYSTVPVVIKYTGAVLPRITDHWFYDCIP